MKGRGFGKLVAAMGMVLVVSGCGHTLTYVKKVRLQEEMETYIADRNKVVSVEEDVTENLRVHFFKAEDSEKSLKTIEEAVADYRGIEKVMAKKEYENHEVAAIHRLQMTSIRESLSALEKFKESMVLGEEEAFREAGLQLEEAVGTSKKADLLLKETAEKNGIRLQQS